MDYLNGVCILLKPNVSRLSLQFRYCFKELMVHLHKSALPNILFCFTNTRGQLFIFKTFKTLFHSVILLTGTFFQPGETINVLRTLLNQIEQDSGIKIPLKKENVFCFENESFRYFKNQNKINFNLIFFIKDIWLHPNKGPNTQKKVSH